MKYFAVYLIIVNIAAFVVWCTDKHYAKISHRRISEKALFMWAIVGGSIGAIAAMQMVRHKTKHIQFVIGLPVILILQIVGLFFLIKYIYA